ncbi:nodulation-signaling pathway 2 protein-like [Phalaenopsis equestris]|uniref:nodulation-signaling pathway 2 protein-like n=1 Tax=Phalaenopsis equestris TaxID=78828 RepID=UPI0009E5850A|nr:nodulation-signaling pathway 2 protein-like [Phalaenopsis equestris]
MVDVADLYYPGYNSAAATIVGWPDWSPVNEWFPVSMEEDLSDVYTPAGSSPESFDHWSSPTGSNATFAVPPEKPLMLSTAGEIDREVKLIHLLMAAAEALAGDHKSCELSKVILARLKELLPPPASSSGTERLIAHFAKALQRLLMDNEAEVNCSTVDNIAVTAASQLLRDTSPYVNFGHFTANQAIVEAVGGERRVHIVDFDIMEGAQWAPLMQAFVSRKDGPPPSHVKITALTAGRKSASAAVQETGSKLAAFAASIGLSFSFAQCRLDREGCFRPTAVKTLRGEAIVFNCSLHAPHHKHHSPASIRSFLASAAEFGARVVTLVEEEGWAAGAGRKGGFLGGFVEEVQRYSTMWDALEAGFLKQSWAREMVENVVFGPRIAGAVEEVFRRREEERLECWSEWMAEAKFRRVELSYFNHWQAKLLLGLFNEGYRIEEDEMNKIVLSWKSGRLVSASVWAAPARRRTGWS